MFKKIILKSKNLKNQNTIYLRIINNYPSNHILSIKEKNQLIINNNYLPMSTHIFETTNRNTCYKEIENIKGPKKENLSLNKNNNAKNEKIIKNLFLVNNHLEKREIKQNFIKDKTEDKNINKINSLNNISKEIESNNIKKTEEKDEKNNENNIGKATINNNFIINKDSPSMINNNSERQNIINNITKNPIINNNDNNFKVDSNNINTNTNIINNINYFNNNYLNNLVYKENSNINKNNIEKSNIINNIRFMRGNSIQPKPSRNSFLNNKHHLLENAIIKKQFQEPKRKVNLKNESYPSSNYDSNNFQYNYNNYNNPDYFQKIISLNESDSENCFNKEEISQDYDEEEDSDDEEYNIGNRRNTNFKRKKTSFNSNDLNFNSIKKESDKIIYEELNNITQKFTFNKTIDFISKFYKNELNINQENKEDNELKEKITNIISKYTKDNINIALTNILSNTYKESQIKLMDLINLTNEISPLEIEDNSNSKERNQRRGKSQKLIRNNINGIREKRKHTKKPSPPFYYGKHFFKINNKIYIYVPKAKTGSLNKNTLYCMYRAKEECMAKIILHQNNNKISYIGNHICVPKMDLDDFYRKYPNIKKEPDWTHIQFAVENEKPFILFRL